MKVLKKLSDRFTVDDVMAHRPCLEQEEVEEYFKERKFLSLEELICMDISEFEKEWAIEQFTGYSASEWAFDNGYITGSFSAEQWNLWDAFYYTGVELGMIDV
jgi:hypothetical protein